MMNSSCILLHMQKGYDAAFHHNYSNSVCGIFAALQKELKDSFTTCQESEIFGKTRFVIERFFWSNVE